MSFIQNSIFGTFRDPCLSIWINGNNDFLRPLGGGRDSSAAGCRGWCNLKGFSAAFDLSFSQAMVSLILVCEALGNGLKGGLLNIVDFTFNKLPQVHNTSQNSG